MRAVFGLVLVVGLALAGIAVYMVQGFVGSKEAEAAKERAFRARIGEVVEIYVTNKPLVYGVALTKEDVEKVVMPKSNLPEGFFEEEALLFPGDYSKPRYVMRQMDKMEPLLATKVSEPGQDISLTARLNKGMRAFAIKVDVASGVSGFLQPDDLVDVYWTGSAGDVSGGDLTRLIESSVRIIAVDQTANNDNATSTLIARTVTVEATPEEVARLAQAQATGRLALSLVGANEVAAGLVEVNGEMLIGTVAPEKVCSLKTRKGAEIIEMPIPCTN
jgi:pilus assembly protein CpaB